jgi:hypothetical protein
MLLYIAYVFRFIVHILLIVFFTGLGFLIFLYFVSVLFRNFALAYYMRENNCFPPGLQLQDCLDFYFQV